MRTLRALLLACALVGCQAVPRGQEEEPVLGDQGHEFRLSFVLDVSGSFIRELEPGGKAYPFLMSAMDRYEKDKLGSNVKVIVSQISGTRRALLWDGTPRELKERFPDARAFMNFVVSKSNPNGSRVHDGVTDSLEYLMSFPGVAQRTVKTACLVLSDFDDNFPDEADTKKRLIECLGKYAKTGGSIGFYWVDVDRVPFWHGALRDAGFRHDRAVVVADIAHSAPLPNFE